MAFEKRWIRKKEVQLVSLMDMIFNLLLFFLVTSYMAANVKTEKRFIFPTPKHDLGTAEIFVQWIDEQSVFWIDQSVSSEAQRILDQYSYLAPQDQSHSAIETLKRRNTLSLKQMGERILSLVGQADTEPGKKYFVLLRCPNEIPFSRVMEAVALLSNGKYNNIEYGTVGGTIEQMRFGVLENTDENGNLKRIIKIDFTGEGA